MKYILLSSAQLRSNGLDLDINQPRSRTTPVTEGDPILMVLAGRGPFPVMANGEDVSLNALIDEVASSRLCASAHSNGPYEDSRVGLIID